MRLFLSITFFLSISSLISQESTKIKLSNAELLIQENSIYEFQKDKWETSLELNEFESEPRYKVINDSICFLYGIQKSGTKLITLSTINGGLNWRKKIFSEQNISISDVYFISSLKGLSSSYKEVCFILSNSKYVLSKDIGVTWELIDLPNPDNLKIMSVKSRGDLELYYTIYFEQPARYFLRNYSGLELRLVDNSLQFTSELIAYKIEYRKIYKSLDGGKNWVKLNDDNNKNHCFYAGKEILFINDSIGFIYGDDGSFAYRAAIMKTSDGGETWGEAYVFEDYTYSALGKEELIFKNGKLVIQSGDLNAISNDLGNTWKIKTKETLFQD